MQYRLVRTVAGKGDAAGLFRSALRGIALDAQGHLYAAGDSEIKVFDGAGAPLRRWPTSQPPLCVAVAANGRVFAGEAGQIEIFDRAGKPEGVWRDAVQLGRVTAIGFVKDGVLAGDAADRCIRHFDNAGRFLNNIGQDNPLHGLLIPNGVVDFGVDAQGMILVANPGKHRVERYTPQGELLGHVGRFTGPDPTGFSGCCNPTNVAVIAADRICVTEKAPARAKVYEVGNWSGKVPLVQLGAAAARGPYKLLAMIEGFDANAKNLDIAVDLRGRVYVAEPVRLAVLVFEGGLDA